MGKEVERGVFLLGLVMSLVFLTPAAYAQSLDVSTPEGSDRIPGLARGDDTIHIRAEAALPGVPSIRPNMLKVYRSSYGEGQLAEVGSFQTCEHGVCEFQESTRLLSGTMQYVVKLFQGTHLVEESRPRLLTIDKTAPVITSLDIPELFSGSAEISVRARDTSGGSTCAGITRFIVQAGDVEVGSYPAESESCEVISRQITVNVPQTHADLCVRAEDAFDHVSDSVCGSYTSDTEGPSIARVLFLNEAGQQVTALGERSREQLTLVAEIHDENLDASSIRMTLSGYPPLAPSRQDGETYFWFPIDPPRDTCVISVSATDDVGQTTVYEEPCGLSLDATPPSNPKVSTHRYLEDLGLPQVVTGGLLSVDFTETETGMSAGNAYLDLSDIGGRSIERAQSCVQRGSEWRCTWSTHPTVENGQYTIRVLAQTRDDGENRLTTVYPFEVFVNKDMPQIMNVTMGQLFPTESTGLDISFYIANVIEQPSIQAYIRELDERVLLPECQSVNQGYWLCSVHFPVTRAGVGQLVLALDQGDITYEQEITTYTERADSPDAYRVRRIQTHPESLDPRVLRAVDYPLTAEITLAQLKPDIAIATQTIECQGMSNYLADKPYLVGEPSLTPVAVVPLVAHESDSSYIPVACQLHMQLRTDEAVFATPYIINISKNVMMEEILVTQQDQFDTRIDTLHNDITELNDEIEYWKNIDKLLRLEGTIVNGVNMFALITEVTLGIMWVLAQGYLTVGMAGSWIFGIGLAIASFAESFWRAACQPATVTRWATNLIFPPGTIATLGVLAQPKLAMAMASCKLCGYEETMMIESHPIQSSIQVAMGGLFGGPVGALGGVATSFAGTRSNDLSPVKSIHIASRCMCPSGIAYNLEKERQLTCRLRNCLQTNYNQGLPLHTCEISYKNAECLYVDGAAHKLSRRQANLFQSILGRMITDIPLEVASVAWLATCNGPSPITPYAWVCPNSPPAIPLAQLIGVTNSVLYPKGITENAPMPLCHIWGRSLAMYESASLMEDKYDWDELFEDIQKNDYCRNAGDAR